MMTDRPLESDDASDPFDLTDPGVASEGERVVEGSSLFSESSPLPPEEEQTLSIRWLPHDRKDIAIPSVIGNVRILAQIGRGGMGVVCSGWDKVLRRQVAVKFLLGAVTDENDPHFQQFIGGARAEAAARHPNIVVIHAAGVIENIPYLVMDYIDGPTLREIITGAGGMSLAAAAKVMWDVSSAAAALHERDLIHRDLKPGNVLFDRAGRLFVTDFGLASLRRRSDAPAATSGTPAYMAPEAFDGVGSPQSDIYAMGIMFFELLAGSTPFNGDLATLRELHTNAPLPVEELGQSVPPPIVELIERAAHKKSIFRYKSAEQFQRALRDSLAGVPEAQGMGAGEVELKRLVLRCVAGQEAEPTGSEPVRTPSSRYFERLTEIADQKRAKRTPPSEVDAEDSTQDDPPANQS